MLSKDNPLFVYSSVLEPWIQLAVSSPSVMGLRICQLPWLWWSNPLKANEEIQRMFWEKSDAWQETALAVSHVPMRFYFQTMSALLSPQPARVLSQAMVNNSKQMARPSSQRVNANQKRLTSINADDNV